ncbi:3-oxoacyl-[acyl-carrier-protein] synthase III C-terminal domain-containing protein [Anaerocolumna xylanovorans]|uniref:3-oxoacyl-[acyl-carrier-protein] synthase-3 n=1 Tax=Anaerocolumna xylanovorans DSM 12503 TaxID=1121345 RepID=A0A1M7Y5E2_9FIRM|nr:3-oxoacyl-[acyl-carrier-protein] synthase III C-terminal domain-containing protein [Anaerocolumna xylanovorans]SHO47452.1 3-oxoacyl-[acyl-carrier-protein] synthase-3 [Anaerocolumna xylanovorans DSM 12503]
MIQVKIRDIAVSHGKRIVDNEPYLEHFRKRGKDVEHFLRDVIGREKRFLFEDEGGNTLTLSLEAVNNLLDKTGLTGSDMDMIILSSQLPEYTAPPTSIKIHSAIGGKNECICYDVNSNCCGMALALEQAAKYMALTPHVERVLLVGCDYINMMIDEEEENLYGHYGDAACALIMERTEEDAGIVDSVCTVKSEGVDVALFPGCGFSNILRVKNKKDMLIKFVPPTEDVPASAGEAINTLLKRNGMTKDNISMFCFSQYALINIRKIRENFGIDEAHSLYIGDEYGYTGTSSPFITLYESINRGFVKRGDYILIWTIGCGSQNIGLLCKY